MASSNRQVIPERSEKRRSRNRLLLLVELDPSQLGPAESRALARAEALSLAAALSMADCRAAVASPKGLDVPRETCEEYTDETFAPQLPFAFLEGSLEEPEVGEPSGGEQ